MLSFLARSALCIGAVAAAASGAGPERLIAAIGREAHVAADAAGRACLASSGCLQAGAEAVAAASATAPRGVAPPLTAAPLTQKAIRRAEPGGG